MHTAICVFFSPKFHNRKKKKHFSAHSIRLVQPILKYKKGKAQVISFFNILAQKMLT